MENAPEGRLVGRVVDGRYLVEALIADGGLTSVYLVLDRRLDRRVAMKVLPAALTASEAFLSRFADEARAAARLSHPNVVPVLDQGSDGSLHYLTMEHLPGRTLREVLTERRTMTVRECVAVLTPVLDGLAAAHRLGIVHGDLKPENVFLTDDGRIMVADLGLARAITAALPRPEGGTGRRAIRSTESVDLEAGDPRTDVHALGVLLVELLTGRPPTDSLGSGADSLEAGIPVAFDPLVRRATAADREQRPADATAFQSELQKAARQVPADQQDLRAARPSLATDPIATDPPATKRSAATQPISDRTEVLPVVPPTSPTSPTSPATRSWEPSAGPAAPAPANGPQPTLVLPGPHRREPALGSGSSRRQVGSDEGSGWTGPAGPRWQLPAVAAAVVLLLLATGTWWFVAGPGASVSTPTVAGRQLSDAQQALSEQGLNSQVKLVFDAETKAGLVISTDPTGGASAKKKSTVVLTVSKGPEPFPVPNVSGKSVADATAAIQAAHLRVGETTSQYSSSVKVGAVISTAPKSGTELTADQTVDLIVSGAGVIKGLNSGRCVDIPSDTHDNGIQTVLQDCNGSPGQAWTQTPAGELTTDDGAKCLDVAGASRDDGARVQIWDCAGVPNQKWTINDDGTIVGVDSGKCLDATDHRSDNGTPIQMWSCNGGDNQKWSRE